MHEFPKDVSLLVLAQQSVQGGRGHPVRTEAVDLVLHEADQRAQDDRGPLADQWRQLVADGFSAAGGQDQEGVAAVEDRGHGLPLERSQFVMSPDLAEKRLCPVDRVGT